jgi:cytosine/adenosine deaminase-related metal-dependent hydrolase
VHGISIAAQPKEYRQKMYQWMADTKVGLVVCPSAALSMRQLEDKTSQLHNSITNVPEALAAGVTVAIGVDNVYDFYQPFVDGDIYTEARMMMEACRYYNIDEVVKICTTNGLKLADQVLSN